MSINLSNLTMSRVSAGSITTPPPSGDPYWSSVSLLTETTGTNGQNNLVFVDSSTNNFTIANTNLGYAQGTFSPVVGGHSAGPGGDFYRLDLPNFSYANGDFTIEAWVYPTVTSINRTIFAQSNANQFNTGAFRIEADNRLTYTYFTSSSTGSAVAFQGGVISPNVWTHVAISRSGTTTKLFVNGVVVNTATIATMYQSASASAVGGYAATNVSPFYGYLSDVRVTTAAVYTGNFSVPTAPLTAITGTQLLLSFNNAGIYDATAKGDFFTKGDSQVSTAQKKFGTTSVKFDGSGDYLYAQPNAAYSFGTGDFTVEGWVYFNVIPSSGNIAPFCQSDVIGTSTNDKWWFGHFNGNLTFATHSAGGPNATTPWTPSTNTWYYVAATRSSGTMKLFINGVSGTVTNGGTGTFNGKSLSSNGVTIGAISTPYYLNGYMQDVRLTKGVARYTATFAAPTEPFPTN